MNIRLQLVIEQNLLREGLLVLFKGDREIKVLPSVTCKPGCAQACNHSECDIILMGMFFGSQGSLDCVRQIMSRCSDARILLIICKEQASLVNEAIRTGAKGVVSMDMPSAILRKAIRIVAGGGKFIEPWLARANAEMLFNHASNPFDILSAREHSVLHLMLNGCNCASIAVRLHISEKTVANHHTHIMKKLAVKNLIELTRMAICHNLISA